MFKKKWKIVSLAVLGAVFFVVYLYLYLPSAPKCPNYLILNQPDESINYFFIRELALNNRFGLPEPLAGITASQVHPRSTTVVNGAIVPIGFPGVIVFFGLLTKLLVKIFGIDNFNLFAIVMTPLLAAVTPLFFYGFLRRVWDEKVAWLSSVLLFFLPPWWYYASRPFQHNTLLMFLIVVGLYFYTRCHSERLPDRQAGSEESLFQTSLMTFLSGLCFGLAIYVRPSEIVWLAALGIYGLVMARKVWSWREYFFCGVGLVLTAILFFTTQIAFYGFAFASGYVRPTIDGAGGIITAGPQGIGLIKAMFLPFGLHFGAIARNFYAYFFKLFGAWSLLALAGAFLLIKFKKNLSYFLTYIFGSIYLLIFYGSWQFFDNLLREPSIGTSYVRYFLLIYVFGLPFLSFFLLWLWQKKYIFKIVTVILFMALAINSLGAVFAPLEGLSAVKATVARYGEWQEKIYSLTENNAVIVTRYADKYLFPGRKIIPGWEMTEQKNAIILLAQKGTPIYLYDLKLTEKEEATWRGFLSNENLKLSSPLAQWEDLELRKIK
ncbi:MAG: hypothetical protein AAB666_00595 [Patescibacteria group bacterium]|mgnify:CR=1 FL=1